MARPPFFFGNPEIVMQKGRYMGEPTDPGAPGFYMGETLAGGELYSRYSSGYPTGIPIDTLSPEPFSFAGKRLLCTQETGVVSAGRDEVTLEFIIPGCNELAQEFVLQKGGVASGSEPAGTLFSPIKAPTFSAYAGGLSLGAPGGDSTILGSPLFGARKVNVASATGFLEGDWVKIENPIGGEISVVKIKTIAATQFTFESDILMVPESGAYIRTINDFVTLTETTDYTANYTTGDLVILETGATTDKCIWVEYKAELLDYDGADFWLLPGLLPLPDYVDPALVSVFPGAISLGSSTPIETEFSFEKDTAFLGRDYTLYAIAKDAEVPPNPSLARAVSFKFIPARPVSIFSSVSDSRVDLNWNDVTLDGSAYSGYNVVRNDGSTFVPALAKKLNVDLITTISFTDEDGAANRVSVGVVPAPVNGQFYTYAIETGSITGQWSILTQNLRVGQVSIITAEKPLYDIV